MGATAKTMAEHKTNEVIGNGGSVPNYFSSNLSG
jgi:hypothetical protein